MEKLFQEQLDEIKPQNEFENLPKFLLSKIISSLQLKDISKIWVLNKFFFKFLCEKSPSTNNIWISYLSSDLKDIDPIEIDSHLKEYNLTPYEKRMNKYHMYLKVKKKFKKKESKKK